jgi:hypothetical protein
MHRQSCPKSGVKIHETPTNESYINQQYANNKSRLSNPVNFYNTSLNNLDLDLDNYSLDDLFNLFNITDQHLDETTLKNSKHIVLKMHPDKSKLDAKYFLFFSKAYKRLHGIYEFKNKSTNKQYKDEDFYDETNTHILNNMFEKNKDLKKPAQFNNWFNDKFQKHSNITENTTDNGYGDWLKSNDDYITMDGNITKGNMNEMFEKKKKQIQAVTLYTGVTDMFANSLGASLLDGTSDSFTTDTFTDLKTAYTQTLIPVTNDDYNNMQKFNTLSEYKTHRNNVNTTPLTKKEAMNQLMQKEHENEKHSTALAYKYAVEMEKTKQRQNNFWSDIKRIT